MKKRVSRAPALATGSDGTAALAQTEATGALAPANATPPAADAQRQAPAPCTAGVASKALYGESAGGHEEIVGTATPREEQLQHVPVAVAATSGRMSGGSGVVALRSLTQVVPGLEVVGIDISSYAIENAKEEVRPFLQVCDARKLPFADKSFDLIIYF